MRATLALNGFRLTLLKCHRKLRDIGEMKILQIRNSESGIFPGHKIILKIMYLF